MLYPVQEVIVLFSLIHKECLQENESERCEAVRPILVVYLQKSGKMDENSPKNRQRIEFLYFRYRKKSERIKVSSSSHPANPAYLPPS